MILWRATLETSLLLVKMESGDDLVEGYSGNQPELCSHWTSPSQCMAPIWVMPQQFRAPESSPHTVQTINQSSLLRALCLNAAFL